MWYTSQWWQHAVAQARAEHPRDTLPPAIMADWLDDYHGHNPGAAARSRLIRAQLAGDLPDEIVFRLGMGTVTTGGEPVTTLNLNRHWGLPHVTGAAREGCFPGMSGNVERLWVRFGLVRAVMVRPYKFRRAVVGPVFAGDPVERAGLYGVVPLADPVNPRRAVWADHGPETDDGDPPPEPRVRANRRARKAYGRFEYDPDAPPISALYSAVLGQLKSGELESHPAGALGHFYERFEGHLPYPAWKCLPRVGAGRRAAARNVFPSPRAAIRAAWVAAFRAAFGWAFPGVTAPTPAPTPNHEIDYFVTGAAV